MIVYVLRHGKSPQLLEAGVAHDADRPLAEEGRQAVRKMVRYLREEGGRPSRILTSPLVRARETAREVAQVLKLAEPELFQPLDGGVPADKLWEGLKPRLDAQTVIVGHQPQLGDLVAYLSGRSVDIKPGGMVALEATDERVRLLWSKNPKELP